MINRSPKVSPGVRALVEDAIRRARQETADEEERTAAVWISPESRAARARQREKLKGAPRG